MPNTKEFDSVAVFWDYENCPAPANASGYSIANNICTLARPFGVIKLFKAYLEISDQFTLRSELQSSGVSLVDCPHNGRKEVADKMLLVDMLAYAIDNPAPSTIILITGDRDFAYALSILKHRQYKVVLVTPPKAHASLVHQACVCYDWLNINHMGTSTSKRRKKQDFSKETRSSPSSLTNDVADAEDNDNVYPRKEVSPTYPTRNTRAPNPSSKSSRNISFQNNHQANSPISQYRNLESMIFENQTTMNASSGQPSTNPAIKQWDKPPPFLTNGTTQDEEGSRHIPKNSLLRPIALAGESPLSTLTATSEASSPPASPLKESDHESDTEGPPIVPSVYIFLVKILQGHRRKGIIHSYRSVLASKMAHEQPTYHKAGVNTFAEFMYLAQRNGIVELGGVGKDAWVRLLPDWYDAVVF